MQQLASLFSLLSLLAGLPALLYMTKHPDRKGKPYGREDKVLWISLFLTSGFLVAASLLMFASPLSRLLIVVAVFLAVPTVVYTAQHPPAKGKPFDRPHKLMMIPLFLSFCFMVAAGFPMFARP
jgi:hypothetical protein